MKIAILGTRGIPNRYGGFEQAAEVLSIEWKKLGHEVTVYNPMDHSFKGKEWRGVKINRIYSNEKLLALGTIIFDCLCLKDALNQDYDIVLELGYSASIFYPLIKKRKFRIITNMDGLEWKRDKWNTLARLYLKYLEKQAILESDVLIADNESIQDYLKAAYKVTSFYIPYGTKIFETPNFKALEDYDLRPYSYYLLIARLEPENNIEMVLDGYIQSKSKELLLLVGNYKTKYGNHIVNKYKIFPSIKFLGGIYNYNILNNIRYFSKLYFHGHSVGGTNPSLLEAMGCGCYIAAHNNSFNRNVLEENAFYFNNSNDVSKIIIKFDEINKKIYVNNNKIKIREVYNWDVVSKQYLEIFKIF
jgi:hypothetical protein